MGEVQIKLTKKWYNKGDIFVCGTAFERDKLLDKESIISYFSEVQNWTGFIEKIKKLNGFFSVIIDKGTECYVAVDRVRSIPLFYSMKGNNVVISDDPYWIQSNFIGENYDLISIFEYLLTGYVTGRYTFNKDIHQIQAGGAIRVLKGDRPQVYTEHYYKFITGKGEDVVKSEHELIKSLDDVTIRAIERLVNVAGGRTIVIPLSGGLDSRLIAMTLKRLGYKNIIAFSYGVKDNWESHLSKEIALHLNIPWHFVEYNRELWKKWYWSEECQAYIKYASNLVSLAHLQDWPAVMELKSRGILPENAIIAPGHTNDFVTGGHIPLDLLEPLNYNINKVIRSIWQHHYNLMPTTTAAKALEIDEQEAIKNLLIRINNYFGQTGPFNSITAVGIYENWEWAERQAKYIVNSVRVYDFFGFDWWMPWWDYEVITFWEYVPLRWRRDRLLNRQYVEKVQERLSLRIKIPPVTQSFLKLESLKLAIKKLDKSGFLRKTYSSLRKVFNLNRSPAFKILALGGAFDLHSEKNITVLGIATLKQVEEILNINIAE